MVFDLVPFAGNEEPERGMQPPQCPPRCQFIGDSTGETFYCAMPTSNNLIRPFFIEIGHPEIEATFTLLVSPHPNFGNDRLVLSFQETYPFVLEPIACSYTLKISTSNEVQLEVSIDFEISDLFMYIDLSAGASFTTRLLNCQVIPEENPIVAASSLRALPHSLTKLTDMETLKASPSLPEHSALIKKAASAGAFRYTNPVTEALTLYFPESLEVFPEVMIYSMQGRLIARHPAPAGVDVLSIPVSQLTPGAYVLRVQRRNGKAPESHIFIKL